jgi:hypothetical protein
MTEIFHGNASRPPRTFHLTPMVTLGVSLEPQHEGKIFLDDIEALPRTWKVYEAWPLTLERSGAHSPQRAPRGPPHSHRERVQKTKKVGETPLRPCQIILAILTTPFRTSKERQRLSPLCCGCGAGTRSVRHCVAGMGRLHLLSKPFTQGHHPFRICLQGTNS